MARHWYNNGVENGTYEEGMQPDNWVRGRLSGCGYSTLGKHWYNNGTKQGNFIDGEQPEGWVKGTLGNSTKGYKTYNNGVENRVFSTSDKIPEGWVKGRLKDSNNNYIKSASKRRVYYYNNGIEELKFIGPHTPPEDYTEGRLSKRFIKVYNRDKEFLDKGYVPLKELVKLYGKSWYVYLDDIDKICFKEPYVYVNKSEIPRIEEYIKTNHSKGTSVLEQEIAKYVKSIYNGNVITNTKAVLKDNSKYYELDIYIPDKKVAIEINGIYWHSTNAGTDKNYHINKTNVANKLGIRLIHIFQDQWISKNDICKSIIKSALGICDTKIYARNCEFKQVSRIQEREFLNNNHIQGFISSTQCYGLYYKDELVQLVSFRKSRFEKDEIELVRQCSKLGHSVVGGFSKLMVDSKIEHCISYVDRSLFTGQSYYKIGFSKICETPPSYYYFNSSDIFTRLNRINFQKHKLSKLLKNFDNSKTEIENMLDNGYLQVYDCGTYKVRWDKE